MSEVLRDYLIARSVFPISTILVTKYTKGGPRFKGGALGWNQIQRDLKKLLGDTGAVGVTTMIDYYGLPNDVPGMANRPNGSPHTRVEHVEGAIAARCNDGRFRPYLMLHELEAMLFTDISKWEHRFDDAAAIAGLKSDVRGLLPEAINETPHGAPSRRLRVEAGRLLEGAPRAAGGQGHRAGCDPRGMSALRVVARVDGEPRRARGRGGRGRCRP